MAGFFPRFQTEISPLIRLADELDHAARSGLSSNNHNFRSFKPRFDVKETNEAYELHGELPGIEQDQINIEWSDDNTLTISGQTEHRSDYTNDGEKKAESGTYYHKPSVEDVEESSGNNIKSTEVAKTNPNQDVAQAEDNAPKFWVTERSFGSFHRTFQFPSRVDLDAVTASLKNGILNLKVPKAKAKEPRRIQIS